MHNNNLDNNLDVLPIEFIMSLSDITKIFVLRSIAVKIKDYNWSLVVLDLGNLSYLSTTGLFS